MKFLRNLSKQKILGKICLLRVDLNISEKEAKNSPRILGILPTIKFLTDNGAKVVILSHRGRPEKKSKILCLPADRKNQKSKLQFKNQNFNKEFSLKPFAKILSSLLKKPVHFIDFKKGFDSFEISNIITRDSISILENLRFLTGEEKNDKKLAKQFASFGDFYVNDAFAVSHRKAASIVAITEFLPSYAGLLLEKEVKNLSLAMKNPKKPLIIILGGAKISDKIGLIENFESIADYFLIGGGIAHNFLKAQGLPMGDSIFEEKTIGFAKKMLENKRIILPIDYVVKNRKILDIGPNTAEYYSNIIKSAKTIIWNGPMGYFENKKFAKGSEAIAKAVLSSRDFAVVGGGETATLFTFLNKNVKIKNNIFLSTGGGAMLEYLAGKKLPGIKALK